MFASRLLQGFTLLIAAFSAFTSDTSSISASQSCNSKWTLFESNCYFVNVAKANWYNTEVFCKESNAHLTSVHSDAEISAVVSLSEQFRRTHFLDRRIQELQHCRGSCRRMVRRK
ncbi:hypothetical protein L596_011896 [Steinernema carpocapsae]|uniref:C-type lectin domain-containing protein n=1 Tax=Steinernema carpocapsae TaxID=34508 RepID=A0A4U5NVD5_STECR|nr:hypothetical protein L596_011896 [Steinernema carpocapsae]